MEINSFYWQCFVPFFPYGYPVYSLRMEPDEGRKRPADHTHDETGFDVGPMTKKLRMDDEDSAPVEARQQIRGDVVTQVFPRIVVTPAEKLLDSFPAEILRHIFTYLPAKDRIACQATCIKFNSIILKDWKKMQRSHVYKLYVERLSLESLLIKIQSKEESTECVFEIEVDGGNITIESANGDLNGIFDPTYRGKIKDKVIKIFEDDPYFVLWRCLEPIMMLCNFDTVQLDDILNDTMIDLKEIFKACDAKCNSVVYRRRKFWDRTDEFTIHNKRPRPADILDFVKQTGCRSFDCFNYRPGNHFWDSPELNQLKLCDGGEEGLLWQPEIVTRIAAEMEINWGNNMGLTGIKEVLQAWQAGKKQIKELTYKIVKEEDIFDIYEWLQTQDTFDKDKAFFQKEDNSARLLIRIDIDNEKYLGGAVVIKQV